MKKLDDIVMVDNVLYFEDDAKNIFGEDLRRVEIKKRDPYLHRIFKNQLKEESSRICDGVGKCMLENLAYPVLIASHIKPFINCSNDEAYEVNNGLLLSKTIDSLFDLKYISFNDDGSIIFFNRVSKDVEVFWKGYKIDDLFINDERKHFLEIHRQMCVQANR